MNRTALLALARALEDPTKVPPDEFVQGSWSMCAAAWAMRLGIAPEGLTPSGICGEPVYGDRVHHYAIGAAYGITPSESLRLFGVNADEGRGPAGVAARIREFVG